MMAQTEREIVATVLRQAAKSASAVGRQDGIVGYDNITYDLLQEADAISRGHEWAVAKYTTILARQKEEAA